MDRKEHIQWCKDRALECVERGELREAYASMSSDMQKHPDTEAHTAIGLGLSLMLGGQLSTPEKMANFINGFG